MIELKNISKVYQKKKGHKTSALNDISISFDEKGMTFILGKSGSGKSTLLNILGGLDQYDSGDMLVLGKSTKEFSQAEFDSYRNTYIGFVFQEFHLLEDYDVYENVALSLQLQQKKVNPIEVESLLEKLGLKELQHRKVNELSGGQKGRVAIARALIKNPKLILADEPTGNLDSETGHEVMNLLKEISKEKLVIIVSHDRDSAFSYGDRVIEIKDGQIIFDQKKKEWKQRENKNYQAIFSKLPLKESFRLGLGSLRHKKIKLCFTVLLTVCALLFLSITDTLSSYNINLSHARLLKEKKEQFVQIEKYQFYSKDDFVNKETLRLKESDIKKINEKVRQKKSFIYGIMDKYGYHFENVYNVLHISSEFDSINYTYGTFALEIVEGLEYLNDVPLYGRKPNRENEIVISNVIANLMIKNGVMTKESEKVYFPKNYDDILNQEKTFLFGDDGSVKVVGIINYDMERYENVIQLYKDMSRATTNEEHRLYQEYSAKLNNVYNKIFVKEGFVKNLKIENKLPLDGTYHYQATSKEISLLEEGLYLSPSLIHNEIEYFDGTGYQKRNTLQKNEVILNIKQLKDFDASDYREKVSMYINQNLGKDPLELEKEFFSQYVKKYDVIGKQVSISAINHSDDLGKQYYDDLKIVGIVGLITDSYDYYYVSSDLMGEYEIEVAPVSGVFVLENTQKGFQNLMNMFPYNQTISLKSSYSYDVNDMVRMILVLKKIAFYCSLVLIIFTVILMTNFIFSSISYRKKEIGILRGLGARRKDVMKIFLWEGLIFATIAFVLASIALFFVTYLLNHVIMAGTDLLLTPFILTFRQFIVIALLVYVIVFISSIIPMIAMMRRKPIDVILNR